MTNELEKQFFDTFGIEKREIVTPSYSLNSEYYEKTIEDYPQITDHILLELLCILADLYDSNSHGYPLLSKDIKELKEDVLDDLMGAVDVENDYPEGYVNKIRALFGEEKNEN